MRDNGSWFSLKERLAQDKPKSIPLFSAAEKKAME